MLVMLLSLDHSFSRVDGIIMLVAFAAYMAVMVICGIRSKSADEDEYKRLDVGDCSEAESQVFENLCHEQPPYLTSQLNSEPNGSLMYSSL